MSVRSMSAQAHLDNLDSDLPTTSNLNHYTCCCDTVTTLSNQYSHASNTSQMLSNTTLCNARMATTLIFPLPKVVQFVQNLAQAIMPCHTSRVRAACSLVCHLHLA